MAYARREFRESVERRQQADTREHATQLRQMAQAAVPIGKLTHSEEWNYFLSIVQESINRLGEELKALQAKSLSERTFEYTEMVQHKAQMIELVAQKLALEQVIDLPRQILEKGKDAQLKLDNLDDE